MSHDRYNDTAYSREEYKPMCNVMDGKNKGAGHKRRRLGILCDTDDKDNAEKNHEVFERPPRKNNGGDSLSKSRRRRWFRGKGVGGQRRIKIR